MTSFRFLRCTLLAFKNQIMLEEMDIQSNPQLHALLLNSSQSNNFYIIIILSNFVASVIFIPRSKIFGTKHISE